MFNKFSVISITLFLSSVFLSCSSAADNVTFTQVQVTVNQHTYPLEYAQSFAQRAQGLMYRKSMCASCGMLFNFQQARAVNMWMKNTYIPLDVAFIRADGFIVNIEHMQPLDLSTTSSHGDVLYAWEMNQGWFAEQGISVGDTVVISQ